MKIGVLSDTHDQIETIEKAVHILNRQHVSLTVHCGDWVSPFSQYFYRKLESPLKGIFGNNDGDIRYHLISAKKFHMQFLGKTAEICIGRRNIFVYHGENEKVTQVLIRSSEYDAVFHGHTHVPEIKTVGSTLSLNPGSLMSQTDATIFGASFAIYDTNKNSANIIYL